MAVTHACMYSRYKDTVDEFTCYTAQPHQLNSATISRAYPSHRLARTMRNYNKQPIVLVACGSFSPVTFLHLRMFEMAMDFVRTNTDFEIIGGYLSPVSDQYKKPGLLSATHR